MSTRQTKITAIVCLIFAAGLFAGCQAKEQKAEQKAKPAAHETEVKQPVHAEAPAPEKAEPVIEPSKEEAVPEAEPQETVEADAVPTEEPEETILEETAPSVSAEYLGVKKCKACHLKQYKAWKKTTMADSFENLKALVKEAEKQKAGLDPGKDYTTDEKCLRCHTTGYGRPGGFKSAEETPHMAGVQCEGCHGPGSEYRKIMKKNKKYKLAEAKAAGLIIPAEDEKGCMSCHGSDSPFTEKVDPKYVFDFKARLEKTHRHYPLKYEH